MGYNTTILVGVPKGRTSSELSSAWATAATSHGELSHTHPPERGPSLYLVPAVLIAPASPDRPTKTPLAPRHPSFLKPSGHEHPVRPPLHPPSSPSLPSVPRCLAFALSISSPSLPSSPGRGTPRCALFDPASASLCLTSPWPCQLTTVRLACLQHLLAQCLFHPALPPAALPGPPHCRHKGAHQAPVTLDANVLPASSQPSPASVDLLDQNIATSCAGWTSTNRGRDPVETCCAPVISGRTRANPTQPLV